MKHFVLFGIALVVFAACTTAPSSSPAASPTEGPTPTAVTGAADCTPDQLALSAGHAEGAMGTNYIEIQVVRQSGEPCEIIRWPNARIVDAAGNEMVAAPPSSRLGELVEVSERFTFNLGWSSWCNDLPARPYFLEVGLTPPATARLQLPETYAPSDCLGASSTLRFDPAS
jgi:hypothetical protein